MGRTVQYLAGDYLHPGRPLSVSSLNYDIALKEALKSMNFFLFAAHFLTFANNTKQKTDPRLKDLRRLILRGRQRQK